MDSIDVTLVNCEGMVQGEVTVFPPDEDGDIQIDFGAVHVNAGPETLRKLAIAILRMTEEE